MKTSEAAIPIKNYIILIVLSIITIFIVFYFARIYQEKIKYDNQSNNTMSFLSEIKAEELSNYILENHDIMIYLSSSVDTNHLEYEKQVKKYIVRKNLTKDIIYLDTSNLTSDFYRKLESKYLSKELKSKQISLDAGPNVLIIKGNYITNVLYQKKPSKIQVEDIKKFIENNWAKDHD